MRKLVFTISVLLIFGAALSLLAQHPREGQGTQVTATQGGESVFGTIVYDPGAPQDSFRGFSGTNQSVGNVFNSALTGPLKSGTISAVTVFPVAVGGDVIASLFGPTAGGVAPVLGFFTVSGVVSNTFNIIGPLTVPVGPTFLAGIYVGTFGNGPDSMGMRSATTNGQGFHAMQINFIGATVATGFQTIAGQNAMIRASGDVLVPVELMNFTVE